jgi:hypothetical protein
VQFLGAGFALMGVIFTGVDLMAGMPAWWTVFEGPPGVVIGGLMYALARSHAAKQDSE